MSFRKLANSLKKKTYEQMLNKPKQKEPDLTITPLPPEPMIAVTAGIKYIRDSDRNDKVQPDFTGDVPILEADRPEIRPCEERVEQEKGEITYGLSCQHWHGNQMCVIDCETTGLDPLLNEIYQLCILPLQPNLEPRKDVLPFNLFMKPNHMENMDREGLHISNKTLDTIVNKGVSPETGVMLLREWVNKLKLPLKTGFQGGRCQIIPLGQNYGFDRQFLLEWLGKSQYEEIFHYHYRDTMLTALYMNDRAVQHGHDVLFNRVNLTGLAKHYLLDHEGVHDALFDCALTAKIYKKMISEGLF